MRIGALISSTSDRAARGRRQRQSLSGARGRRSTRPPQRIGRECSVPDRRTVGAASKLTASCSRSQAFHRYSAGRPSSGRCCCSSQLTDIAAAGKPANMGLAEVVGREPSAEAFPRHDAALRSSRTGTHEVGYNAYAEFACAVTLSGGADYVLVIRPRGKAAWTTLSIEKVSSLPTTRGDANPAAGGVRGRAGRRPYRLDPPDRRQVSRRVVSYDFRTARSGSSARSLSTRRCSGS